MAFNLDGNVRDQNGIPVPGALVYVYDYTGGLAELTDALDQPLANPVVSGEDGYWSAYAADEGYYTLKYWWAGRLRYVDANVIAGREPLQIVIDTVAEAAAANAQALTDINVAGSAQVSAVNTAGATQVAAVETAGAEQIALAAAEADAAEASAVLSAANSSALQKRTRYGVAAPLITGASNAGSYSVVRSSAAQAGRVKVFHCWGTSAGATTLWRATKTGDQSDPTAGTYTQVGADIPVTIAIGLNAIAVDFAVNAGEWLMVDTNRIARPAVTGAKQYRLGVQGTRSGAAVATNNVQFQAAFDIEYLYLTTTEFDTAKAAIRSVVAHKYDAAVARPTGFGSVEWRGYVKPTNAIKGDTVVLLSPPVDFAGSSKSIPYIADRWCQIYAGDIEPFQVRSGLVEDVFDRSGCDNHLNATAQPRKPAYLAVDSNFNDKPSLVFSGLSGMNNGGGSGTAGVGEPRTLLDRMNRPGRIIRQGATFFFVLRLTDLTGLATDTRHLVNSLSSFTGETMRVTLRNGEWAYYAGRSPVGGEDYVKSGVALDTNPHLITVVFDGVNSFMKIGSTTVKTGDGGPGTMASIDIMRSSSNTVPAALAYFDAIEHACTAGEIAAMEAWASATFGAGVLT